MAHFLYYLESMAKTTTAPKAKKATTKNEASKPAKAKKAVSDEIAVIMTGGKQYIVSVGDTLEVERLPVSEGDKVVFDKVLLVDNGTDTTIGTPYIDGAKVNATCKGDKKGEKITIVRYKAKSNRDRKVGHRQKYTLVHIDSLI